MKRTLVWENQSADGTLLFENECKFHRGFVFSQLSIGQTPVRKGGKRLAFDWFQQSVRFPGFPQDYATRNSGSSDGWKVRWAEI